LDLHGRRNIFLGASPSTTIARAHPVKLSQEDISGSAAPLGAMCTSWHRGSPSLSIRCWTAENSHVPDIGKVGWVAYEILC